MRRHSFEAHELMLQRDNAPAPRFIDPKTIPGSGKAR